MGIDHSALPGRVRRGILMVVIAAPLNLCGFIPPACCLEKIPNPKSVIPACSKRESRSIRILTWMGFRQKFLTNPGLDPGVERFETIGTVPFRLLTRNFSKIWVFSDLSKYIARIIQPRRRLRSEPSRAKATGLCLGAACRLRCGANAWGKSQAASQATKITPDLSSLCLHSSGLTPQSAHCHGFSSDCE
jgi:hypothetical protein